MKKVVSLFSFFFWKIHLSWMDVLFCLVLHAVTLFLSSEGRILLKLGQVQFELQKLVDTYVSCMLHPCTFPEAVYV